MCIRDRVGLAESAPGEVNLVKRDDQPVPPVFRKAADDAPHAVPAVSYTHLDVYKRQGADLVQIYTGFVYEGPGFAGDICRALIADAERAADVYKRQPIPTAPVPGARWKMSK